MRPISLLEALLPRLARLWHMVPEALQWRIMWLLNATFSAGVTGIVFDDDGRVLLVKHTFRRRYPWGLVSGWVHRGETLEDALHRELAEETALSVVVDRLFRVRTDRYHLAIEAVFICRLAGGTFRPSAEITDIRWCRPERPDDVPEGVHPHHFPLIHSASQAVSGTIRDR